MKYLQKQDSFSFSTSSSKTGLFSDDEDGASATTADGYDHTEARISDHQQNGYFEISLPPPPPTITKTNDVAKEEEFEFCFSFNSSSSLVNFHTTTTSASSNHPFHHHEPPIATSVFTSSKVVNVVDRKYKKMNNPIHYKRVFQRASSPRCHQGSISPYVFPTSRLRTLEKTQREFIKNGNPARLGGIRKLMVKLRSMKSLLYASRRLQHSTIVKVNNKTKKTYVDHKLRGYNHMPTKSDNDNNIVTNTHSENNNHKEEKWSRIMSFNGFSKMFNVIKKNIRTTRSKSKQTVSKSCPVSIKSSPMHDFDVGNARDERRNSFYSRDHSIQAAIAHCKKSFGK